MLGNLCRIRFGQGMIANERRSKRVYAGLFVTLSRTNPSYSKSRMMRIGMDEERDTGYTLHKLNFVRNRLNELRCGGIRTIVVALQRLILGLQAKQHF